MLWHLANGSSYEELSQQQRQALQAIAKSDATWEWPENVSRELGSYGLPTNREHLQRLLG